MSSTILNKADIQAEHLERYLRSALDGNMPLPGASKNLLGSVAELITMTPLVFVALVHKALQNIGAKPEDVQVLPGIGGRFGEVLAVMAGETKIAEVRFCVEYQEDFLLNAHIKLTKAAVELIEAEEQAVAQ